MRNHTATHLLHAALRTVLGKHVKQAGSVVDPGRLRFDFTHYAALDPEELAEVERLVNDEILKNVAVHTDVMDLDHALSTGAMALFGEKYGDQVRVVSVRGFSKELCGGTHVRRTGDIGLCKIVYEGSISQGVRRIEAITGEEALRRFQQTFASLHRAAHVINTPENKLIDELEKLLEERKSLEKRLDQMKERVARAQMGALENACACDQRRSRDRGRSAGDGSAAIAYPRRFAAEQTSQRGCASVGGRLEHLDHHGSHQGSHWRKFTRESLPEA